MENTVFVFILFSKAILTPCRDIYRERDGELEQGEVFASLQEYGPHKQLSTHTSNL